jgi:hypothetical protein
VFFWVFVAGEKDKRRTGVAMRERNARIRAGGKRSRHARNDFKGDFIRGEASRLFTTTAEDKRIAALEPHNAFAGASPSHQKFLDFFLRQRVQVRALADIDFFAVRTTPGEHLGMNQIVIDQYIGR